MPTQPANYYFYKVASAYLNKAYNNWQAHYHFNPIAIQNVFKDKGAFSDNEVTLLVETQPLLISLSATYLLFEANAYVIIEMRCIEQQRKISQVHYQGTSTKSSSGIGTWVSP